jgi:hypothetical protein
VHPKTGLLCESQLRPRSRWRNEAAERRANTQRRLSDRILLRRIQGIWFQCEMEKFPEHFSRGDNPWRFDLAERRLICGSQADDIYGRRVYCVAKRQLSRKELRKFGLMNATTEIHLERRVQHVTCIAC